MANDYGKLTEGEKVIWSVFYTLRYYEGRRKHYDVDSEVETAASAAEEATYAVDALRRSRPILKRSYGQKYIDVVRQMVQLDEF